MSVAAGPTRIRGVVLVTLVSAMTAGAAAAADREVRFGVERDGLKYQGPCSVSVVDPKAGPEAAPIASADDAANGVTVPDGNYLALFTCPSTEGTFTQAVPFRARRDELLTVTLQPAFVLVQVKRDGAELPATVQVYDANDRQVQAGKSKVAHPVPAGSLLVRVAVSKKAAKTRKPLYGEAKVRTKVGEKSTVEIDLSDGLVELTVLKNGRSTEGAGALRRPGSVERLVEVVAGEPVPAPPGTYDLISALYESHDFHEELTRNVVVTPGKTTKVRVKHVVGTLEPTVTRGAQKLTAEGDPVEIDLFLGEAPSPFNTIVVGEAATLSPGAFRIKARFPKGRLDDGGPWEQEGRTTVRAGRTSTVRLDLEPAAIDAVTSLGGEPIETEVGLVLEGGSAPITRKLHSDEPVTFLVSATQPYTLRSTLKTGHGEHVVEAPVTTKWGRRSKVALTHDLGKALVQVFDRAVAVSGEVRFVEEGTDAPEKAPSLVKVKAGQEAYLPPGSYVIVVERGGKTWSFAPIKIAAGRTVERQVELAPPEAPKVDPSSKAAPDDGSRPAKDSKKRMGGDGKKSR